MSTTVETYKKIVKDAANEKTDAEAKKRAEMAAERKRVERMLEEARKAEK